MGFRYFTALKESKRVETNDKLAISYTKNIVYILILSQQARITRMNYGMQLPRLCSIFAIL